MGIIGYFLAGILILTIIGPEKLPRAVEEITLAIENFRRQQADQRALTLAEARRSWKSSGSAIYAIVAGLYQGAEHLNELRRRLMTSAIVLFVGAAASLFVSNYIFSALKLPAGDIQLIFVRPPEMMLTYFKVALLSGVTVALPFVVYQLLLFIYPAMETPQERRGFKLMAFIAVPAALVFFVGGFAFSYFIMLPFALKYLWGFGADIASPMWSISEYINFVTSILFWVGLAFEMPLVMMVLSKMGIVTWKQLASKRKFAIVLIAVASAVITPTPDPFNMSIVFFPLLALFELGVFLSRLMGKPVRAPKETTTPAA